MTSKIESGSYTNAMSMTTTNDLSTNFEANTNTLLLSGQLSDYDLSNSTKTITLEDVNITNHSYQYGDIVQSNETLVEFYVGTDVDSVVISNLNYTYSISGQSQINYTLDGNGIDIPTWAVFDDQNVTLTLNTTDIIETRDFILQSSFAYLTHNITLTVRVVD